MKADHTRIAAFEVNLAIRVPTISSFSETKASQSHRSHVNDGPRVQSPPLLDSLRWLADLADVGGDTLDNTQSSEDYEERRLNGLRGSHWAVSNLHSKLTTTK